jgi:hypothetical protein
MKVRHAFFWITSVIAAAFTLWVAADFFYGIETHFPVVNVTGLILAAAIWTVGWLSRLAV